MGLILVFSGCSSTPSKTHVNFSQPNSAGFAASTAPAHEVQTIKVSPQTKSEDRNSTTKVDPGAQQFVEKIKVVFDAEDELSTGGIMIGTWHLRNQSRAQVDEFDAMTMRLADLLDYAGRSHGLRFTADAAQPVTHHLTGTAYLVTSDGFDQWELYISLRPADRSWTLWQADAPVRLLRYMRVRGQQLYLLHKK